jgi:hypothetical protein
MKRGDLNETELSIEDLESVSEGGLTISVTIGPIKITWTSDSSSEGSSGKGHGATGTW